MQIVTEKDERKNERKFYLAPLEGITGYVYRNAYHQCFRPMDRYFTPFLAPKTQGGLSTREREDVLPEHNQGMQVIPQILTNRSEDFIRTAMWLKELGYQEVNLNLGCPSGTVTAKGKGAGFLAKPQELRQFLEEVTEELDKRNMKYSVKTRLGVQEPEEFEELLELFAAFPLSELILHPRVLKDYYKNTPRLSWVEFSAKRLSCPLCYNGDITDPVSFQKIRDTFPEIDTVMIGRGILADPFLTETLTGTESGNRKERLIRFHTLLTEGYERIMSGDRNVLFKMKEVWSYLGGLEPAWEPYLKKLKKAKSLNEYRVVTDAMFRVL